MKATFILGLFASLVSACAGNVWDTVCHLEPRPQEPKERLYVVRTVTIDGATPDVRLAGELTLPRGEGPFPGIVLISGSELTDRDLSILGHNPFLVLADYLTRQGYAVFRHDDRGYGKSTGDAYTALDSDFAADTASALKWLHAQEAIDSDHTGFIGHSQGGFKGPMAAQIEKPDFMIFLAGGVQPIATTLLRQAQDFGKAAGLSREDLNRQDRELQTIFEILRSSHDVKEAKLHIINFAIKHGASKSLAKKLAAQYATPWMMAEFKRGDEMYGEIDHDIARLIKTYDHPVLALYADKDLFVSAEINAPLTVPLLINPNSKVIVLRGLNHFFQPANDGSLEEMCEIQTTIDPGALNVIGNWLDDVIGKE